KHSGDSLIILKYANALRYNGKYEEAIVNYKRFLDSIPGNKEALNGIESCKLTPEWANKPTRYVVSTEKNLNAREADFSPIFVGGMDNSIIFTSSREGTKGRKKSSITGQRNGDLWKSNFNIQKQKWDKPEPLDDELLINTPNDEGAATLSADGNQMLFTRCRFEKKKAMGAQIFESQRSKDTWSEATVVELVGDSLVAAHPALSKDGQTLYFVSDQPGGYGGNDIWKAEKAGDKWGTMENLGPEINTPGNEMFPYVRDNGELYFSSDYHVGMGGFDIFKATKKENSWVVENMKSPINSTGDDFGICFLPGKEQGMFSSNRKGSMGVADDLYSFILPPMVFRVEGEIVNSDTENRMKDAYLRVIGTDGTSLKVRSEDGKFQFRMAPETEYIFAAFKEGFLNSKKIISTVGLDDSKNYDITLKLTPTDAPINIENINYEFGKFDLLSNSMKALDSLVTVLELNPTTVIEIMSHTDFVGSDQFNSELSQKRAQSVVNYLISKGVNPKRLVAKGYGETWPKKVSRKIAKQYDFLKAGDVLSEDYINKLSTDEQKEIAKSLDRRTEFRVLRNDFVETY
ncbi:MAG TPA: OmpA family protein, partial [Prolixibacteraceae bacterium]|nr:OmpA family protein [Prolixibacteraceae bacterium]